MSYIAKRGDSEDLLSLLKVPGNETCMECDSHEVKWASLNLGVLLCSNCAARHRGLGNMVSQVLSLTDRTWDTTSTQAMMQKGNRWAKQYYEAKVPTFVVSPKKDQGPQVIENWLLSKYLHQLYVDTPDDEPKLGASEKLNIPNHNTTVANKKGKVWMVRMPKIPYGKVLKWVVDENKYKTKNQYFVIHSRWISRYNNCSQARCEQRLDLTGASIGIEESETNKSIILAIGPNDGRGMRIAFNSCEEAKEWTEQLRQNAEYYRSLNPNISPLAPYLLIDTDLQLEAHHFDKAKHLGWASKRKPRTGIMSWDRRYFLIYNNILYYFEQEPQKMLKTKSAKYTAKGGFRMNELDVCSDDRVRSGQQHCLLLYHFDRTVFIKFDTLSSFLLCYKLFLKEVKMVDFSTTRPTFSAVTKTIDMELAEEQQKKKSLHRRNENSQTHNISIESLQRSVGTNSLHDSDEKKEILDIEKKNLIMKERQTLSSLNTNQNFSEQLKENMSDSMSRFSSTTSGFSKTEIQSNHFRQSTEPDSIKDIEIRISMASIPISPDSMNTPNMQHDKDTLEFKVRSLSASLTKAIEQCGSVPADNELMVYINDVVQKPKINQGIKTAALDSNIQEIKSTKSLTIETDGSDDDMYIVQKTITENDLNTKE